jgi:pimeloyl-ACP methyl ester carboxylesterase
MVKTKSEAVDKFKHQAEKLSLRPSEDDSDEAKQSTAVAAHFVTPRDPVVETASGDRLPAVPLEEAQKLNQLKDEIPSHLRRDSEAETLSTSSRQEKQEQRNEEQAEETLRKDSEDLDTEDDDTPMREKCEAEANGFGRTEKPLRSAAAPSRTNPLFPPLPLYGPSSLMRTLHCGIFRFTSFFLSLSFLGVIVLGSAFTSIPLMFKHIGMRLAGTDPDTRRPFHLEEKQRRQARREAEDAWAKDQKRRKGAKHTDDDITEEDAGHEEEFVPTEGGKDPLVCDAAYYARRVGLDIEEFKVQTEDGFIITLWHVYNPKEYIPATAAERREHKPEVFAEAREEDDSNGSPHRRRTPDAPKRYPILLIHGLLQSGGAYCTNDDDSLAFFLAKSGYDVWIGNNRCGFKPEHTLLSYNDPRLWAFNIRQMGVMDLPALISRVLSETHFPKLGLICHSQGTTQTFVALAKEQRPDLGNRISVFCALAPAVYAGPLIEKMYFKFMQIISPSMFRIFFGIHAFIPFMMTMHSLLPGSLYGAMGYRVFAFLFNWTDDRWERDLRDRMFQFAPVYVSAEAMRWWLGRECFAKHKCILATREEGKKEDAEDFGDDNLNDDEIPGEWSDRAAADRGERAWYDENAPPMALWIAGNDKLVDGRRLLRRFDRGREPHVKIVHSTIIPEYEHLDVLWAMDAIEKVGKEVREVIWRTATDKEGCAVPKGCEELDG